MLGLCLFNGNLYELYMALAPCLLLSHKATIHNNAPIHNATTKEQNAKVMGCYYGG